MRNTNTTVTFHTLVNDGLDIETPTPMPPAAKLRKFVVAYSFPQYQRYLRENKLRDRLDAVYVGDEHTVLSVYLKQEQIVELPCARRRKDYFSIMEFMQTRVR